MAEEERIRVLVAKPGIDGHWRGAMVVSMALRDAGMEVIYGGNQTPEQIVEAAIQEDVDVVGLSTLAASYIRLIPEVTRILGERGADVTVVVGGTIPRADISMLKEAGVDEVFLPGSRTEAIVDYIRARVREKRGGVAG